MEVTKPPEKGADGSGAPLDVPAEVFSAFLVDLKNAGVPDELIARLQATLLVERTYTERAVKEAVFPIWEDL
jgi:hypothetical protein